jgi:4-hydroxy-tetrahydrodipicolinate synthase
LAEVIGVPVDALKPGVWQILPTPFRGEALEVDHESLRHIVEHATRVGVDGVVALGVLGEASRLTTAERAAVLDTALVAAGDLPVIAGVFATSTAQAAEEASWAAQAGARAVMLLVPSPNAETLAAHARAVADACGVGVVFQDHPATTGVVIQPAELVRAITLSGVGVAVKAESPPTPATVAAVRAELDLPVFGGLGGVGLLDELAAGAAGAMTGFALPEALVACVRAYSQGGFASARAALEPYLPIMICEAQGAVSLAIRKELLRRRGLVAEPGVRFPGAPLPAWAGAVLDAHLEALEAEGSLPPYSRLEVAG